MLDQEKPYLHETPKDNTEGDASTQLAMRCLKTIDEGSSLISYLKTEWELLRKQYDDGMYSGEMESPETYAHSKESFNMVKKVREKMSPLEWYPIYAARTVEGEVAELMKTVNGLKKKGQEVPQELIDQKVEQIRTNYDLDLAKIKAGLMYILRKGGYNNALSNPQDGAHFEICLIGNSFIIIEKTENEVVPIKFYSVQADKVYFNIDAKAMRGSAAGRNVTRLALVFDVPYDFFVEKVIPNLSPKGQKESKKCEWGMLPSLGTWDSMNRSDYASEVRPIGSPMGQYAIYYDLEMGTKAVIVGSKATIVEEFSGDSYPHWKDDEKVIPIAHLIAHSMARGMHGGGIGHYMSEITSVDQQTLNNRIISEFNSGNPIYALKVPPTMTPEEVQLKMREAEAMRAEGLVGMMAIPSTDAISVESISPQPIDAPQYFDGKKEELKIQYGVNQSDVSLGATTKVGVAEIEASAQTAIIQQISENNAGEIKFLLEMTVQEAKRISKNNKTPVPTMEVKLKDGGIPIDVSGMVLGELPQLLKKYDVEIVVSTQSGTTPNNRERRARLERMIGMTAGSPAQLYLIQEVAKEDGIYFDANNLMPQVEPTAQGAQSSPKENLMQ